MGSFALWLMAAFFAVMTALGPTSAFAHAGHLHHGQTIAREYAPASPAHDLRAASLAGSGRALLSQRVLSAEQIEKAFGAVMAVQADSAGVANANSPCDGACCNCGSCGSGCCAAACIIAESTTLPPPDAAAKLPLPISLAVSGNRPASLLEPPNAFA
jgi:hypothetical protein